MDPPPQATEGPRDEVGQGRIEVAALEVIGGDVGGVARVVGRDAIGIAAMHAGILATVLRFPHREVTSRIRFRSPNHLATVLEKGCDAPR